MIAPTGPAKLRAWTVVVCVRLGSRTDQEARLAQTTSVEASRKAPPKRPIQPKSRSSNDCGSSLRGSIPLVSSDISANVLL